MAKLRRAAKAVEKADRKVTNRAAGARHNPVVKALGNLSEVADQPPLIALGVGTALVGAILCKPVMVRSGARMLAAELIATGLKSALKHRIDRTRPEKAIAKGSHHFSRGHSHDHEENSFPSGHTAGAVAVARAVAHEAPATAIPAYALAAAVGAVQMPRGKHYLLDAIAGAAIGFAAEAGAGLLLRGGKHLWRAAARTAKVGVAGSGG